MKQLVTKKYILIMIKLIRNTIKVNYRAYKIERNKHRRRGIKDLLNNK